MRINLAYRWYWYGAYGGKKQVPAYDGWRKYWYPRIYRPQPHVIFY
jgi:hypothetical protein